MGPLRPMAGAPAMVDGSWKRLVCWNGSVPVHTMVPAALPGVPPAGLHAPADFPKDRPWKSGFQPGAAAAVGAPLRSAVGAALRSRALSGVAFCTRRCARLHPRPGALGPTALVIGSEGPWSSIPSRTFEMAQIT
jgi:hypothetical protein